MPESGVVSWRSQSGIGSGLYGSGSFNLFVGLQQSLVDLGEEPMFYAVLNESAPDNSEIYWRLITLDTFDGEFWAPSQQTFSRGGSIRYERSDWQFQGDTERVAANVEIAGLSQQFLPTLYSTVEFETTESLMSESFSVREDGSLKIDLNANRGWQYSLTADIPQPDLRVLATSAGELSPVFQNAVDANAVELQPSLADPEPRPETIASYTELEGEVDARIGELARAITAGASTDFEQAVLLESFLRDPDRFTYSTDVDTGHSSLDLADWLTDPESRNYRTGYCEQFATAMAVMGRALGIPTRVVLGFTPGDVTPRDDGASLITVRESNAHAWVEMWMPGQGWLRFDPTPRADGVNPSLASATVGFDIDEYVPEPESLEGTQGLAQIPREDLLDPGALAGEGGGQATDGVGRTFDLPRWLDIILGVMLVAALVPGTKAIRRRRRIVFMNDGEVEAAWAEIIDRLTDLGVDIDESETPLEIAETHHESLVPLANLYTAAAYGGATTAQCRSAFERAETTLRRRSGRRQWLFSSMSPESLLRIRAVRKRILSRRWQRNASRR